MNASKSIGQDYVIDQVLGRGIEGVDNTDYYTEYEIYTNPTIVIDRIHKDEIEKLMVMLEKNGAFLLKNRKSMDQTISVLDKIRAEIADIYCGQYCENPLTADAVREIALEIIDKYTEESEAQDADCN